MKQKHQQTLKSHYLQGFRQIITTGLTGGYD